MGDLTDAQIRTIRRGLVDFGYRVSEDEVRKEAAALLLEVGIIKSVPDINSIIDTSFLK